MSYSRKTTSKAERPDIARMGSDRGRALSLAILCIAASICLSLLLFVTLPTASLLWSSIQNVGHFFLFATLTIVYISQLEKILHWKFLPKAVLTLIILTIIGILAETLQLYLPGRSASSEDLWRNFAGVSFGLIGYACYRHHSKLKYTVLILCALLLVSIFLQACKPAIALVGYAMLKSAPPTVISIGDPFIKSMISTTGGAKTTLEELKSRTTTLQQRALRMDFALQPYSGVILHEPEISGDTSNSLTFNFFNTANKSQNLNLRIHDTDHNNEYEDRFNTNFYVNPGESTVLIPIETIHALGNNSNKRFMNMQNISEIQLFSNDGEAFTLYLLDIEIAQE